MKCHQLYLVHSSNDKVIDIKMCNENMAHDVGLSSCFLAFAIPYLSSFFHFFHIPLTNFSEEMFLWNRKVRWEQCFHISTRILCIVFIQWELKPSNYWTNKFIKYPLAYRWFNSEGAQSSPPSLSLHCHALGSEEEQYYILRNWFPPYMF